MKNLYTTIFALIIAMTFATTSHAITWVSAPDGNAVAFGVTVVPVAGPIADTTQSEGIYGAGFEWQGNLSMGFDSDLYTWDSYNADAGPNTGTGYWDAFVVTASTVGYYWDLPKSDPIASSASTFVWGGTNYDDGILESYVTAPGDMDYISLAVDPGTKVYVSLVLDTATPPQADELHPSYGSFHVAPVPEPSTILLLGSGLLGLAFYGRRKRA